MQAKQLETRVLEQAKDIYLKLVVYGNKPLKTRAIFRFQSLSKRAVSQPDCRSSTSQ